MSGNDPFRTSRVLRTALVCGVILPLLRSNLIFGLGQVSGVRSQRWRARLFGPAFLRNRFDVEIGEREVIQDVILPNVRGEYHDKLRDLICNVRE